MFNAELMSKIRDRFIHVDSCPYQGPRIYFENAGGSLTLKSVIEVNTHFAGMPDNHGRDNPASKALTEVIEQGRKDIRLFLGVKSGPVFMGETGTELVFRMIRAAALGTPEGGNIVGSTLEHPCTASARKRWAEVSGKEFRSAQHNDDSANVSVEDYAKVVDANTRVATIIHTSPVTGMTVDIESIITLIRKVSPDCIIILDGIQHAAHGGLSLDDYDIDGYAVAAYKVFSKHNYGFAWVSPRLEKLPHDHLVGLPDDFWELGTRDTAAFACTSKVVEYFDWLGSNFTESNDRRLRIIAAGKAIHDHEHDLIDLIINGNDKLQGLGAMPEVFILGGHDNVKREGTISITIKGHDCVEVVETLNQKGIRTHLRRNDHYSGSILAPLGLDTCIRISIAHYNTDKEVLKLLQALDEIVH